MQSQQMSVELTRCIEPFAVTSVDDPICKTPDEITTFLRNKFMLVLMNENIYDPQASNDEAITQ